MASVVGGAAGSRSNGAAGSGRRKSLEAEINLVSFIDLLSMCICFLLMTAVWLEVGMLQVKQSHGTEAAAQTAQSQELSLKMVSSRQAELVLKKGGRVVQKSGLRAASIAELSRQIEQTVGGWVKTSAIGAAMLETSASVSYGDLIQVMDALRRNQVVNLGVVPASREAASLDLRGVR